MTTYITGAFEVKLVPQAHEDNVGDASVGRMSIAKQFFGDLDASSKGQMLAVRTDVRDSAGYVALERVVGTLQGRTGSFALQHSGTMTRGEKQLSVSVVPDSGTGELIGLSGTMGIEIVEGKHFYTFEFAFSS
jgi:hypothetical protein